MRRKAGEYSRLNLLKKRCWWDFDRLSLLVLLISFLIVHVCFPSNQVISRLLESGFAAFLLAYRGMHTSDPKGSPYLSDVKELKEPKDGQPPSN